MALARVLIFTSLVCLVQCQLVSDSVNATKFRAKRFNPVLDGLGLWSSILTIVGFFQPDASGARHTEVMGRLSEIQTAVRSLETAVNERDAKIQRSLEQLSRKVEWQSATNTFEPQMRRMKKIFSDFRDIKKENGNYSNDQMRSWIREVVDHAVGADWILFSLHSLVKPGQDMRHAKPLFTLYNEIFLSNDNRESGKFRMKSYVDFVTGQQMALCSLWMLAVTIQNKNSAAADVAKIKANCERRFLEQIQTVPAETLVETPDSTGSTRLCHVSTVCLAIEYYLLNNGIETTCRGRPISAPPNWKINCAATDIATAEDFYVGTQELKVPKPESQTICGVGVWEDKVQHLVFIRLKALVCSRWLRKDGSPIVEDMDVLRTDILPSTLVERFPRKNGIVVEGRGKESLSETPVIRDYLASFGLLNSSDPNQRFFGFTHVLMLASINMFPLVRELSSTNGRYHFDEEYPLTEASYTKNVYLSPSYKLNNVPWRYSISPLASLPADGHVTAVRLEVTRGNAITLIPTIRDAVVEIPGIKHQIVSRLDTSRAFDIAWSNYNPGTNVILFAARTTNAANQRWVFQPATNGYFYIASSADPKLVLDVQGGQAVSGAKLVISTKSAQQRESQLWKWDGNTLRSALGNNWVVDYRNGSGLIELFLNANDGGHSQQFLKRVVE